jgi:hypothetical protein
LYLGVNFVSVRGGAGGATVGGICARDACLRSIGNVTFRKQTMSREGRGWARAIHRQSAASKSQSPNQIETTKS